MTLQKEMTKRAYYNSTDSVVEVIPGDDITKAAWRFEKKIIEMPTEKSEGWRTFALVNNILDPFQIAASDDYQYAVPEKTQIIEVYDTPNLTIDLSEYEDAAIFRFDFYNMYLDTPIFMESGYFRLGEDGGYKNRFMSSTIRKTSVETLLDVVMGEPDIKYVLSVDMIVFRPREMTIATGEIIPAGKTFETRNYIATGSKNGY